MRTCDSCGHEIEDGWSFCGNCGRPQPATGSRDEDVQAAGAEEALVLFVSLFLPWLGLGFFGSASGISAHGWLFLVMLECLGVLGYLAWTAARPSVSLAPAHWQGLIAATGFASFLTLLGVLISPSGSSLEFGAIVALGGAGAALAGAITTRLAMKRQPPTTPITEAPITQGRPTGAAAPGADSGKKAPQIGRGAIRLLRWGASLAFLGWAVWLISLWKAAHPPSGSLSCTIGQPAPIPDYGPCTPALQRELQQFSSAGNQFAASQWPDYHLNLAWTGLVLACQRRRADRRLPVPRSPAARSPLPVSVLQRTQLAKRVLVTAQDVARRHPARRFRRTGRDRRADRANRPSAGLGDRLRRASAMAVASRSMPRPSATPAPRGPPVLRLCALSDLRSGRLCAQRRSASGSNVLGLWASGY